MKPAVNILLLLASLGTGLSHAQIPNFQHVVIIVQENRTPDNLFQACAPPRSARQLLRADPRARSQYDILTSNWIDKTRPAELFSHCPCPWPINMI